MRLSQVNVPADVHRALGGDDALLAGVVAQFLPGGECRACGRPLGSTGRFSVHVTQSGPVASVIPLHAPCGPSHAFAGAAAAPAGTYTVLPLGLPIRGGGAAGAGTVIPVVLANPSTDLVALLDDEQGGWRDPRLTTLGHAGWFEFSPNSTVLDRDAVVGEARWAPGALHVSTLVGDWTITEIVEEWAALANRDHGFYAALFYEHPVEQFLDEPDPLGAIRAALGEETVMAGWVPLT